MQNITKKAFIKKAHTIASELRENVEKNFESFLEFIYDYPGLINKKGRVTLKEASTEAEIDRFLRSYLKENFAGRKKRIVLNDVKTIPDPAVDVVLEVFGKHHRNDLAAMRSHHRHSMAAENKVGQLLEAYIASKLEPRGWFWCSCNIIKGVDFFKAGEPNRLLQIKNRSNSENSSSEKIRETLRKEGCPVGIDKWYRIESSSGETWWNELEGNASETLASENGFHKFIRTYNIE